MIHLPSPSGWQRQVNELPYPLRKRRREHALDVVHVGPGRPDARIVSVNGMPQALSTNEKERLGCPTLAAQGRGTRARLATAWLRYLTLAVVGIGATTTNRTLARPVRCEEKEVICNQVGLRDSFFGVLACCA